MILPTKHIRLSNSLLNLGSIMLEYLKEPKTVTFLWNETRSLPEIRTYDRFTLCLDLLFILGIIDFKKGLIRRIKK